MSKTLDRSWLRAQTRRFADERVRYKSLAATLEMVLATVRDRYAPFGQVSARPKTVHSFAEKAIRKQEKYRRPCDQLTDLAGGRVVTYTRAESDAVCRWLEREDGLTIDWANSLHTRQRLRTGEFGYIASHYVVQLTGPRILGVEIDRGLRQLKCEIQVATFLQHVWAAIGHDRLYKSNLRIPEQIERKVAEVAALLEVADEAFGETAAFLDQYLTDFETSLSPDRLAEEIERWQAVLAADPQGSDRDDTLSRIGRLHLAAQQPKQAYATMKLLSASTRPDLRRELGRAADFAGLKVEARRHLEKAIDLDQGDWLAYKYLGDVDLCDAPEVALVQYGKAHRLAPDEPRILGPYLECELRVNRDTRVLRMMCGSLQAGIDECERRVDLQVHVPQAHLECGRLALYLEPGRPYAALAAYARAVTDSRHCGIVAAELEAIERIIAALETGVDAPKLEECEPLQGFIWVRDFLRVALVAKARRILRDRPAASTLPGPVLETARHWIAATRLNGIGTPKKEKLPEFDAPVLIVAGGCAPESEQDVESCQDMLRKALAGFTGTVIGGGTRAGISGLTAKLLGRKPAVRLLGYLPGTTSRPSEDRVHPAYSIIETRGCGYTPLGPLQTWADLLLANVDIEDVRVLGVNGGDLAGFEYRLALALGAVVGVIQGTGRAAARLLPDPFWQDADGFAPLPRDWASIAAFVNLGRPADAPLVGRVLERTAREVHENYRGPLLKKPGKLPDNLLPWEVLPDPLKESNRDQVRYAVFVLRRAGFDVRPQSKKARATAPVPASFPAKLELMAELEHGRYNAERLSSGWRLGDVNDARTRTNPSLVPWSELPDNIREYDRIAVRAWPELLWKSGLKIIAPTQGNRSAKRRSRAKP